MGKGGSRQGPDWKGNFQAGVTVFIYCPMTAPLPYFSLAYHAKGGRGGGKWRAGRSSH